MTGSQVTYFKDPAVEIEVLCPFGCAERAVTPRNRENVSNGRIEEKFLDSHNNYYYSWKK